MSIYYATSGDYYGNFGLRVHEIEGEPLGNTIRLNNKQPAEEWLTMSNIGTDIFLELIINAASAGTVSQNELISYLRDLLCVKMLNILLA